MPHENEKMTSPSPGPESAPAFERFRPVARAEDFARVKQELFEGEDIETREEQPHGIDLSVSEIVRGSKNIITLCIIHQAQIRDLISPTSYGVY